jgi:hypothetical protein
MCYFRFYKLKKEYMKKEDFEQRGWKFSFEFDNEMKFEKGDVWKDDGQGAFLYVKTKKNRICDG